MEKIKLLHASDALTPPTQSELGGVTSSDDPAHHLPAHRDSVWWLVLVALVAALLCAPFFRALGFLGDEGVLLHEAELLLRGNRLYAEFFQFLPPGVIAVTAAWFGIAGVSFRSARLLAVLTIVGIACFTFLACRHASRKAPLSAILVIGWVMMSVWPWMQISHHWFATLLSMAAAWAAFVSLEQPKRRLRWP